ncbi:hypothetical protein CHLRE_02g096700v5 [Chlamydomonas reinhardtii]|uniref:BTB domain-containing protein n=1 Tax=Chlamydomonas reinhardtii TaxID=3055 RepID=A0A2K3E213_CHLRE|nr:uncharacterized protein CHLRE_02g096700v5 [Chlamydomonas reinhardtii]PNW86813.1 hypothetical protein CHLRE_02g096700v5 [Chlamydomonas reinhardtii]
MADAKPTVVRCPFPTAIVTRPSPNGNPGSYQTLVWSNDKDALFTGARTQVFELLLSPHEPAQLSAEPLELKERIPDGSGGTELRPYSCKVALHRAVYDPFSGCIYFVEGRGLMRLDSENVVTRVAGHRELCGTADGPGLTVARFQLPHSVTSDGAGGLLVADCGTVRRVSLPGPDAPPGAAEATVATVYGGPWCAGFVDIAYDAAHGRLYAATMSAVYRLSDEGRVPTRVAGFETAAAAAAVAGGGGGGGGSGSSSTGSGPGGGGGGAGGGAGGGRGAPGGGWAAGAAGGWGGSVEALGAAAGWAGGGAGGGGGGQLQGYGSGEGPSSGGGGGGRGFLGFSGITGLVADSEGRLFIADRQQVYRLEADGGPGTVICVGKADTSGGAVGCYPTLLPGGCLALAQYHDRRVLLMALGLPYGGGGGGWGGDGDGGGLRLHGLQGVGRGGGVGEGVAGLLGDLSALLSSPDLQGAVGEGAQVAVAVGGRRFTAHRLILAARCEYFRRLFAGGFADSGAREVVLQDADPDAFAALLRHMYTGELAFPLQLLRPLAELADRLLLPQVVRHVKRRLLAATQPAGVVADMLWAHQQGFNDLLGNLKEWYLEHQQEVLRAAPDSVRQLFTTAPAFAFELHCATVGKAATAGGGASGGSSGSSGAGGISTVSYNVGGGRR